MKSIHQLAVTGNDLSINDVYDVAHNSDVTVIVTPSALAQVKASRDFVEREFDKKIIYGVNTGFGPMASHIIGRNEIIALQENLIRGHAMGMGEPLPEAYVLAAMVVRLNTLAKGFSGASPDVLAQLMLFINHRIVPVVPEHGAVGTSGDLVQLAHIALALIGEGEVFYKGARRSTGVVLKELGIAPYILKPKEGLSLINGTSMMAGISALLCVESRRLVSLSIRNGGFALENVGSFDDGISEELQAVRPHRGQVAVARELRRLLASSKRMQQREHLHQKFGITADTHTIPERVQEVYSLRCIPQIVGPALDTLAKTWGEVTVEINSVTDNPIVDLKNGRFVHGGNFHGDYMAVAIDQLKASIVKLTMLSERRTNFFLNNAINGFFPPFMNLKKPGFSMGLQGLQFVSTSTTAQNQTLAFPHNIHSIPTNGDNQDVVSMGTDATLFAARVIENAFIVFAIELITNAQAVDFLKKRDEYSSSTRELFDGLRKVFPAVVDDREIFGILAKALEFVKSTVPLEMEWA